MSTSQQDNNVGDNNAATATTAVKDATSASYYFDSYSHFGIHEEMLKDTVRTVSYRNSIYENKHLFKDKVVMDVGCGTGILSLFAAKAGAKLVIGIECSGIIEQAKQIVKDNGYEHVVKLVKNKCEDIQELPEGVTHVDIIISEWMGYFLLYESMLNTVLYARDRWLKKDTGMIFPDKATLFIEAIEDADYKEQKINFWDNVYGFDYSCIKKIAMVEPLVDCVNADQIISSLCPIFKMDIMTVQKDDVTFESPFQMRATRKDFCHALVAHFDIAFTMGHKPVTFSTGPMAKYTHWKQTVFYLDETIILEKGEVINGSLGCKPNDKNPRDLDITIRVDFDGKNGSYHKTHEFRLR